MKEIEQLARIQMHIMDATTKNARYGFKEGTSQSTVGKRPKGNTMVNSSRLENLRPPTKLLTETEMAARRKK